MKHILKDNEDIQARIDSWVERAKGKGSAGWEEFSREAGEDGIYPATKAALIEEQGAICCYCEREIATSPCHIEHFQGRAAHPQRMFDYGNMHASCNGFPNKAVNCCGDKRAQHRKPRNPDIPVSPLEEDCETRFRYTGSGAIEPESDDDHAAAETISILGLGSRKLCAMRKDVLRELVNCWKGMAADEFATYVQEKLKRDADGHFAEFFTAIRQYGDELR